MLKTIFEEQMQRLIDMYGKVSEGAARDYWKFLGDIPDMSFVDVIDCVIREFQPGSGSRFPKIPYILSLRSRIVACRLEEKKEYIIPQNERASSEDLRAFSAVMREMHLWVKNGWAEFYKMYQHFEHGLEGHFARPGFNEYCDAYLEMLQREREGKVPNRGFVPDNERRKRTRDWCFQRLSERRGEIQNDYKG